MSWAMTRRRCRNQLKFAKANGISESDFLAATTRSACRTTCRRRTTWRGATTSRAWPSIVINGKYESDVGMAGSADNLIQLTNDLVASEKHH